MKEDLKGKTLGELVELFTTMGKESFRGRQIFRWMYEKLECDFDRMTDLSKAFREELRERFYVSWLEPENTRVSKDGTVKFLFPVGDSDGVESVIIPDGKRRTVCVSTQVGCRMGCSFCATSRSGFVRNLTAGEMIGQVCFAEKYLREKGERVTNVVFMGMGEPLENLDEVVKTIDILSSELAFSLSGRRITVSTCGLIPELEELSERTRAQIAISLNASNDEVRNKLMPINRRYPIRDIISFLRAVDPGSGRRVTIEYVLIEGVNDGDRDAHELGKLLKGLRVKVNLIPYNENEFSDFRSPGESRADEFREILHIYGIQAIKRQRRGADIDAACGQLRGKIQKKLEQTGVRK